jgi:hypothetical protein
MHQVLRCTQVEEERCRNIAGAVVGRRTVPRKSEYSRCESPLRKPRLTPWPSRPNDNSTNLIRYYKLLGLHALMRKIITLGVPSYTYSVFYSIHLPTNEQNLALFAWLFFSSTPHFARKGAAGPALLLSHLIPSLQLSITKD